MDFDGFERRMLLRRIEHIDQEIVETKRQIARHGATEIDLEIIRLQAEARMNYSKCLAVMMAAPQVPLTTAKPVTQEIPVSSSAKLAPPPASGCDGPKAK